MKKIPSVFQRLERSSLVNTANIMPECEWVFDPRIEVLLTIKRDGTPVRYVNDVFQQRRTLKSRLDPGVEGIPQPKDFEPCQPTPGYDDESKQWEWPGWVPLETQFKALVDEAVLSRGGMNEVRDDGQTFELCGPKINGNPENLDMHQLFMHGEEIKELDTLPLWPEILVVIVKAMFHEGVVVYEIGGQHRMAKLKRRDLGLDWPIKSKKKVDV